ncbi:hypothetical protein H0H93_005173 [Arthromyces matolae]|nr:hypothetical protein H0H93_005173 [Arthromyces matolae]
MSNVHSLAVISVIPQLIFSYDWDALHFKDDLIALIQSPSLKSLELTNLVDFPLTAWLFKRSSPLENLSILYCGDLDVNHNSSQDQSSLILDRLTVDDSSILFQILNLAKEPQYIRPLSFLRRFAGVLDQSNAVLVQQLFALSANTLQELELSEKHSRPPWEHALDLSPLRHLGRLDINVQWLGQTSALISWYCRAIDTLPERDRVTHVTFRVFHAFEQDFDESWQELNVETLLVGKRDTITLDKVPVDGF